ncbi:MAG: ATP-binding protein [Candidatus Aminicenantes bacterium]|nr:ATP-binding protein [Candidatus Aminicenantes bacterium]
MILPSWWQVAIPHKDIRENKLNEAIFAADLGDVILGQAPQEYQDASFFFQKTYLTSGLKSLLENVLSLLDGGKGDPVIQVQTPFGGGKTHALLVLYHFIKNRKKIEHLEELSSFPEIKNAKVAAFIGTHADAVSGKTPWGEIAKQLGHYEIMKDHDLKRIAPGKEKLRKLLEISGPTLILMDEILEYIVKANRAEKFEKITQGQTLAFMQELSEVVAATENCCLVISLPSSILESYSEDAEKALQQLQKISGRVEAIYTPVEGVELYEVIRTRLFENYGEEKVRKQVAESFFRLYQRMSSDVPSEVREISYKERIEKAYPFHPELIDVLYERWGSYPTFQRTRGVLRLLGEVVADLYKKKKYAPLIQSSLINLRNQTIRREFIKHIGNEFEAVIASDIAGKNAKAPQIDKKMGSEYENYNIARGASTSVFLYSFSAGESKFTTLPRVRVALLKEGIPTAIVGDSVAKLGDELWYFHSEKNMYSFRNQPNLNRVIIDKEETILEDLIQEEIKSHIQKFTGNLMDVYVWPEESSDIPDTKRLKLVIFDPDFSFQSEKGKQLVEEVFNRAGVGLRAFRNALILLLADEDHYNSLKKAMRRFLAVKGIQEDHSLLETLTSKGKEELKEKFKDVQEGIPFKILNAYRHLAYLGEQGISWRDLGMPTIRQNLSERVLQYLKDQEKLLSIVTPKYILQKYFGPEEKEKTAREIYDLSFKAPGMPLLENENVLMEAIERGVKEGILGLREDGDIYYKQLVSPNIDSIILRGDFAEELKKKQAEERGEGEEGKYPSGELPGPPEIEEGEKKKGEVKRLNLKAIIPWDQLSSVITGVIRPLKDKGGDLKITVQIDAESEEGFDRNTLDLKVKETLKQIGGIIEEWDEE